MSRGYDVDALRRDYGAFLGIDAERVLLTGHSHQAWPDAAREAMARCFDDAARFVDDKWGEAVFPLIDRVGRAVLARSGFSPDDAIAFGRSTHELVYRLLTCLPRDAHVVTTRGEFHSLDRQLRRLEEDGLRVTWVDSFPRATLSERLLDAIVPGVSLVAVSAVFFEDGWVLREIGEVLSRAVSVGALPLVDAYHAFHAVELDWGADRDAAFLTGGGYKYAGFGEGVCWLRVPRGTALRPAYTGWFADFEALERPRGGPIGYGAGGARFAGATFDPTAFYRAEATLGVFDRHGLTPAVLADAYARGTARLTRALEAAGVVLASSSDPRRRGGFVAARASDAQGVARRLRARKIWVDARGDAVRLGPAPYLTDDELDRGAAALVDELGAG